MSGNELPFDPHTVELGTELIDGKPALHIAAEKGNTAAMQVLLDCGERFGLHSMDDQNVLHLAAMNGLDDVCRFVLQYAQTHSTPSCTHSACSCERNFFCFIDAVDFDMNSPLSLAIKNGHISTVEILMQFDSTPNLTKPGGELTVDCYKTAIDYNQLPALRFLLRRERPIPQHLNRLLIFAIHEESLEMLSEILSFGADPSKQFSLQAAAEFGNVEIMKLLVEHGVKINLLSLGGQRDWPKLHITSMSGNEAAVKYALKCGAKPTVGDESRHLAFKYTGTGLLMAFAELGIAFPTLRIDHLLLWPDLEKKLEVWNELGLPINLATQKRIDFVNASLVLLNRKYNHFSNVKLAVETCVSLFYAPWS